MKRRDLLKGALTGMSALVLVSVFGCGTGGTDAEAALAALEHRNGGRLGVSILDTRTGGQVGRRSDERFLVCSTFKLLAAAAVLARVDQGVEQRDRHVVFDKTVLLEYAPVNSRHVGAPRMRIAALREVAITLRDNTAANLLLPSIGGPNRVTTFIRCRGDPVTRLDRTEPELNLGSPGDMRDTNTPHAMFATMHKLLLGNALSAAPRGYLPAWLGACRSGAEKLHPGLPANWQIGDRTGSGSHGKTNDVAIVWSPDRKPLLMTAYYAGSNTNAAGRNDVPAGVGRIAASV